MTPSPKPSTHQRRGPAHRRQRRWHLLLAPRSGPPCDVGPGSGDQLERLWSSRVEPPCGDSLRTGVAVAGRDPGRRRREARQGTLGWLGPGWGRRGVAAVGVLALTVGLGQAAATSSSLTSGSYLVVRGDTLWAISQRFGVTVSALAAANGISDPNFIEAGTALMIPARATGTGTTGTGTAGTGTAGTGTTGTGTTGTGTAGGATDSDDVPASTVTGGGASPAGSLPAGLRLHPERLSLVPLFQHAAAIVGVPAGLLEAISWQESGWQAGVVSPAGAIGIGQVTPGTVDFVRALLDPSPLDPGVAGDNIMISARFLRYLLDQTGWSAPLAVAAYYQGLASVRDVGILPETQQYVADVVALEAEF